MKKQIFGALAIAGLSFALASCDSNKTDATTETTIDPTTETEVTPTAVALSAPNLTVSEKTVSWEAVANATGYIVNVNGTDLAEQTTTSYTVTDTTAGDYVIKVKAVSSSDSYTNSEYSSSVTVTVEEEVTPIVLTETTLWLVGDSTVCSFNDDYYLPRYGYGTQLDKVLDSKVTIKNLALSGRSSRSFLEEANYETLTEGIKSGDYLVIGFGHNDEKNDTEENITTRYCAPTLDAKDTEKNASGEYNFQYILNEYYIEMATLKGATPILCTPIVRLNNKEDYSGSSGHVTSTGDYPACIKDLGEDTNTTVIDLTNLTKTKYTTVGYDVAKKYHAVTSCKYDEDGTTIIPNYSSIDNTHINKYGAKEVSYLFANALKSTTNTLGNYVLSDIAEPTDADYDDAINKNKTVSVYNAVNWSSYSPASNYTVETTGNLTYNGTNVGYGWCGTAFGSIGGTSKKWYATETETGTFKVGQSATENGGTAAGKIASSESGFGFLFSQIDVNYNFKVTATLKVAEKVDTSQCCFGLMLRDDCYVPTSDKGIASNAVAAGLCCTGSSAMVANWSRVNTKQVVSANSISSAYAVNDTADVSIVRAGQVVICTVVYKGETYTTTYTDFDFVSIDSQYMYVGILASRGTIVTTSNLSLEITGVAQAA